MGVCPEKAEVCGVLIMKFLPVCVCVCVDCNRLASLDIEIIKAVLY
jgi:hypothetical protein